MENLEVTAEPMGVYATPAQVEEKRAAHTRSLIKDQYHTRLKARYDAADTTFENERMWASADLLSADASLSRPVRERLIKRSRYEAANNAFYAGALESDASAAIGPGPNKRFFFGDATSDGVARELFRDHARSIHLAEKCRQARMAWHRDGASLMIPFTNRQLDPDGVQLDLRITDCLQLKAPDTEQLDPNNIDGVILDENGEPSHYQVLDRHPSDGYWGTSESYTTFSARGMVHYFEPRLPGQHQGCPSVTPVLPLFAQFRRYKLAVLTAAETAANVAAMLKLDVSMVSEMLASDSSVAASGLIVGEDSLFDMPRGSIPALPPGYGIEQVDARQPTDTMEMFEKVLLREIARCFGQTYNVLAGDSSSSNMASGTLDERRWWRYIESSRGTFDEVFLDKWVNWWWAEQRLIPYILPSKVRSIRRPRHRTTWPTRFEHSDPVKVAEATKIYHGLGLLSDDRYLEGQDIDPADHAQDLERQVAFRKSLGINVVGEGPQIVQQEKEEPDAGEDD